MQRMQFSRKHLNASACFAAAFLARVTLEYGELTLSVGAMHAITAMEVVMHRVFNVANVVVTVHWWKPYGHAADLVVALQP
jgi:hypothetical protein